jgi:hypothetical protein
MSPLMMRFFTLVGIALAAASMQLKARAEAPAGAIVQQAQSTAATWHIR